MCVYVRAFEAVCESESEPVGVRARLRLFYREERILTFLRKSEGESAPLMVCKELPSAQHAVARHFKLARRKQQL